MSKHIQLKNAVDLAKDKLLCVAPAERSLFTAGVNLNTLIAEARRDFLAELAGDHRAYPSHAIESCSRLMPIIRSARASEMVAASELLRVLEKSDSYQQAVELIEPLLADFRAAEQSLADYELEEQRAVVELQSAERAALERAKQAASNSAAVKAARERLAALAG